MARTGLSRLTPLWLAGAMLTGCMSVQHETFNPHLAAGAAAHPWARLSREVALDVTRRETVLASLGTPHAVMQGDNGSELLRWDWPTTRRTRIRAFPLLDLDLSNAQFESLYVEISDGRVRRYWVSDEDHEVRRLPSFVN